MPEPGSLVGRTIAQRYRIEQLVGGGAMGDVYRARHIGLDTDVALKIMRPSIAGESNFKERFYREAKAASRLEHPNSVRVLDYGQEPDGVVYLAMEFLRGRDLLGVLHTDWPLSDERVVDILVQTLAAVSTAHGHGIVHRDLKPENIMIVEGDDDGRDGVKVCDFGIAKLIDARAFKSHEDVKTALTTGNAIIGTPEYMSPEQARGESLDARSDLYSVGVILYRMLTGRLPFDAENAIGIAVKQILEEPVAPSRVVEHVNPRLEAICLRALRKDPRDRYATAKEMRAELRAVLDVTASAASGSGPTATAHRSTPHIPTALEGADTLSDGFAPRQSTPVVSVGVAPRQTTPIDAPPPDSSDVVVPLESSRRALAVTLVALLGGIALTAAAFVWPRPPEPTSGAGLVATASAAESATPTPLPEVTASVEDAPPLAAHGPRDERPSTRVMPRTSPPTREARGPTASSPLPSASTAPPSLPTSTPATQPVSPLPASSTPPATDYRPTNALVSREPLTTERVQRDVLERKLAELAPRLNDCYRDALFMTGAPVGGRAEIHMSIDPAGHVVSVVTAPQLPSFQRCAGRLVSSLTVPPHAVEAGGGTAEQGLKLIP